MGNNVAAAKQDDDKNSCTIYDIEHCEKGVAEISDVDDDGEPTTHRETDFSESYSAYYYCTNCGVVFDISELGKALAWDAAKEHLDD